jgi:AraC-like DNA-binding protein
MRLALRVRPQRWCRVSPSVTIAIGALNGVFLALLVWSGARRHVGARWLAVLLCAIALRTVPYVLGFAGAYDRWRWLTFAPFDVTLAWGPLLWVYVTALATGQTPQRLTRHFVPVAVQLAYQLVCFSLGTDAKWSWYTTTHLQLIEPVGLALGLLSLIGYLAASARVYREWQQWLDANISSRDESRLTWLRVILLALTAVATVGLAFGIWHWAVAPLDYFGRAPFIVMLTVLVYLLGLLGWRFGHSAIQMSVASAPATLVHSISADSISIDSTPVEPTVETAQVAAVHSGYQAQADAWQQAVVSAGWHRDSSLTLTSLAQRLGTSPRTVSRVLSEGLGTTFNDFVNRLRALDVARRLEAGESRDVLGIAFDAGFASKASFNRAFKRHIGRTPTQLRQREAPTIGPDRSQLPPIRPLGDVRRAVE